MVIQIRDPDTAPDPYCDTGKTCLGGGMHCPSASSFCFVDRRKRCRVVEPLQVCYTSVLGDGANRNVVTANGK